MRFILQLVLQLRTLFARFKIGCTTKEELQQDITMQEEPIDTFPED